MRTSQAAIRVRQHSKKNFSTISGNWEVQNWPFLEEVGSNRVSWAARAGEGQPAFIEPTVSPALFHSVQSAVLSDMGLLSYFSSREPEGQKS